MSTHYLINQYNDEINDVVASLGVPPQTQITGNYVVRVPDDVIVQNPTDLPDLITKKYAGILGTYGLFTQIAYDDMLDESGVNLANSTGVLVGKNGAVALYPTDVQVPVLETVPLGITWGGPGAGPAQATLTYELFEVVDSDARTSAFQRSYREVAPDVDVTAEVSFDGGVNFISATDKALLTIPNGSQGTQVILRFTRVTDVTVRGRVFIGSWALLF